MSADQAWAWALRLGGLAGVAYETLGEQVDRPVLLGVFLAMMGLSDAIDRFSGGRR